MIPPPHSAGPRPAAGPSLTDGNGRVIAVAQVASASVLPYVGDSGVMVDLTALRRSAQGLDDAARWSVWLGPQAPSDALDRLAAAGLQVDAVTTAADREDELGREGPALALRLLLVCALAGAVLAASAVAISVAVTGRRRSYELAALHAVAVRRSSLVWACVLEQGLLLGIGLMVGVPVGLVVARVALPLLPQTSTTTSVPLTLDVQTFAVGVFVVATTILLLTTAVVAGLALVRQAVPDRLREAAP
jgi:predicted lysophospholipase L1 biosynthesis ABC-type transport system permease subunit